MTRTAYLLLALLCALSVHAEPPTAESPSELPSLEPLWIGRFDVAQSAIPADWELRSPDPRVPVTRYQLRLWDDVAAVEALADRSMAMLARPVSVDLARLPVLCWRWRVEASIAAADMRQKRGDDYAARVYVGFRLPVAAMSRMTRVKLAMARRLIDSSTPDAALNYVWDNQQPVGTERASAYTDRVQMLVLQSGDQASGRWQAERRNVLQDFARRFGAAAPTVDFVAFGSDADNTGSQAHAGFADLHFVAGDTPCMLSGPATDVRP